MTTPNQPQPKAAGSTAITVGSLVSTSLALLQVVLANLPQGQVVTGAENAAIAVEGAIAELLKVTGSDVTWQQLNDLRVQKTW